GAGVRIAFAAERVGAVGARLGGFGLDLGAGQRAGGDGGGGLFGFTEGDLAGGAGGLQFGHDLGAGQRGGLRHRGGIVQLARGFLGIGGGAGQAGGDQQDRSKGFHDGSSSRVSAAGLVNLPICR